MKIAIVNIHKSRTSRVTDYHIFTTQTFITNRSAGNFEIDIIDAFMTDSPQTLVETLKNSGYSLVLFYVRFWNVSHLFTVLTALKNAKVEQKMTIGLWGYDTFANPEKYLKAPVSFIIQDEPELSLYEVASNIYSNESISKSSGIIYKDEVSQQFAYGPSKVLSDLDLIPSPYLNELIEVNSETAVFWEVARGCLFRCDFCVEFSHLGNLRHHRFSYLEKELDFFAEKNIGTIIIGAPVFNLSHQHFKQILASIKNKLPYTRIEMYVRPDILNKEEIEFLSEMNVFLHFGIQTFNSKLHSDLMTSLNLEKTIQKIKQINNYPALSFDIDLIGGLPKTTYNDFLLDLDKAVELWPININIYHLSLYPGTRIFNRIREFEMSVNYSYPYKLQSNNLLTKNDVDKIDMIINGVDTLYNQGRMLMIIGPISKALEQTFHEIIEKWIRWIKKQNIDLEKEIEFETLYSYLTDFFKYLFERFQKRKLWDLASDMLLHNYYFTKSMMMEKEDTISYPYEIDMMNNDSKIFINDSSFLDSFSYNIEDVIQSGYINLKKYASTVDKEKSDALIYRIEGIIVTKTILLEEANLFKTIKSNQGIALKELIDRFPEIDIPGFIEFWCDEGVLFIK